MSDVNSVLKCKILSYREKLVSIVKLKLEIVRPQTMYFSMLFFFFSESKHGFHIAVFISGVQDMLQHSAECF